MNKKFIATAMLLTAVVCTTTAQTKTGADKDKHGCRASAGYTYSELKKECIRVFEQTIQLNEVNPKGKRASIAAVILSDDQKKAEVFIPQFTSSQLFTRVGSSGKYICKNIGYTLVTDGGYTLLKQKNVLFKSKQQSNE